LLLGQLVNEVVQLVSVGGHGTSLSRSAAELGHPTSRVRQHAGKSEVQQAIRGTGIGDRAGSTSDARTGLGTNDEV
jgi:hypothetical protein